MGLKGSAFLAIWHDIAEGGHEAYIEWHTREHMPERLSIPGFRTGKRLHAPQAARHVFGTIYAADDVEVFRSPAYLERLNHPTRWTAEIAPSFQNFLRVACDRVASAGTGDGGSMATLRFDFAEAGSGAVLRQAAQGLVDAVLALPGVACAHLGIARSEVSGVRTRETELRSAMAERGFDVVLLLEGASQAGIEAALPEAQRLAIATGALAAPRADVYETAFSLTSEDMQAQ
ncbi:hypothetical protein IED13_21640 [Bosea sp. SSUT16]|jgi:hypothetical protein|uniref:Uncharacterized protein n=1 Tax=Bosea spartocytisi TaxID=2773451 RepID=A0A927I1F2_9HYPH|nr:hypothetical protein [Bosea spartocytisi]MBD3848309.1 hypothetical protein [Bosea spartocytisi]MCT4474776.1 hypothetical protein [Bosea spartocytisi]